MHKITTVAVSVRMVSRDTLHSSVVLVGEDKATEVDTDSLLSTVFFRPFLQW